MKISLKNLSIGAKLTALSSGLVIAGFAVFTYLAISSSTRASHEKSLAALATQTHQVLDMLAAYDGSLRKTVELAGNVMTARYAQPFRIDPSRIVDVAGTQTFAMENGGKLVNNDSSVVDAFTRETAATATVFERKGDDFIRIATSLKKQDGTRAIGTTLDRAHPAYRKLLGGEPYTGKATLFSKEYMTRYLPIRDAAGKVVGAYFIGLDFTDELKALAGRVRALKVGETGYVYALDASPANAGLLTIHPAKEGQNILGAKDSAGNEFIRKMIETRRGTIVYPWVNKELGETTARDKIVVYADFPEWNWVVGGGSYIDEFTRDAVRLRNILLGASLVTVLVLTGLLYWTFRRVISRPMKQAVDVAERVGAGDLTSRVDAQGNDEIGQLLRALGAMNDSLVGIVSGVRSATDEIASASQEIAKGNADLSQRTEQQASSLEETASSMEELASTVKANADNATQANRLAAEASEVAVRGGAVVGEVVQTMSSINEASRKIADIIGVIDGIAFQTNILALNAAVEAARAGEQGRGFAVVATEVRTLAQRSAGAAKEIKQLISESVSKVEDGSKLVDQAGKTMDEIVASVQRVTDIMGEISSAAHEQTAGIEQVNQAVMQMDQMTQQNAALVEQAAAAAESMHEQAGQLGREVSVFKLSAGEQIAVRAEPAVEEAPAREAQPVRVERRSPNRPKNVTRIEPKKPAAAPARTAASHGGEPVATARFRKQHEDLGVLAGEFAKTLDVDSLATDAQSARRLLSEFAGKIGMHLAMEDKHLYPSLMASKDARTRELATRYMAEMGSIAEVFTAYTQRWSSASAIQKNPAAFAQESRDIMATLWARIQKENSELYVAADRIAA